MADGTKAHGLHDAKNELNIVMGYMPNTGVKQLMKASVKSDSRYPIHPTNRR